METSQQSKIDPMDQLQNTISSFQNISINKPIAHTIGLRGIKLEIVISPAARRINYHWTLKPDSKKKGLFFAILKTTTDEFIGDGPEGLKATTECIAVPEIGPFDYCTTVDNIDASDELARLLFNVYPTAVEVRFIEVSFDKKA